MSNPEWEYFDAYATFLERDSARELAERLPDERVHLSGGFHPGEGQYVIDPDYMELLGLSPEELIRNKK